MKKLLLSFVAFAFVIALAACAKTTTATKGTTTVTNNTTITENVTTTTNKGTTRYKEEREVTILAPQGTPALVQMYIEKDKADFNYKIDLCQGSDPLAAAFASKSYDFIYAPLNLGAKLYVKTKGYKLLATVVDCNYYFVTTGVEEINKEAFENKSIVVFGQAAMSGILSRMILSDYEIDLTKVTYVSSVADSQSTFIADSSVIALVSEPQLSAIEKKVEGVKSLSVKNEYTRITGETNLPQAACFVNAETDSAIVERYLANLEISLRTVVTNVVTSAELGSTLYTNFAKPILMNAIPRSEIVLTLAKDAKPKCEKFFALLDALNPEIIGGEVDEGFYY